MQYKILLARNENTKVIEKQEQSRFIKATMEAYGVPIDWNTDEPLSISDRNRIEKVLDSHNISVIDSNDGNIKMYVESELIGEWKKPFYVLKQDISKPDKKKQLYVEMNVNFWTVFENQNGG